MKGKSKLFINLDGKVPDILKIILTSLIFVSVIGILISQVPQVLFTPQTDVEQSQDSGSSSDSSNDSGNTDSKNTDSQNTGSGEGGLGDTNSGNTADIDPNAVTNRENKISTNVSSNIAIPGYGSITVPANQTEVEIFFENPISNSEKYYLTFELILKNTNETLYKSKMVPPGKAISNETLSRPLSSGSYDAIVKVQPYYMDSLQPTNNANIETKLIVK